MNFSVLSQDQLGELDRRIDSPIPRLPLMSRRRESSLLHLIRVHEERQTAAAFMTASGDREAVGLNARAGLNYAVQWVHEFGEDFGSPPDMTYVHSISQEADATLIAGQSYSKIFELMSLLWRGILEAATDDDGTIHVRFRADLPFSKELTMAADLIAAPYDPSIASRGPILTPELRAEIAGAVRVEYFSSNNVHFDVPDELFEKLADRVALMTDGLWWMDPSWSLGPYTLEQYRDFWTALNTHGAIHDVVYLGIANRYRQRRANALWRRTADWISLLSRHSGLAADTASAILNDLVYDPALHRAGTKRLNVHSQPFFKLGDDMLTVSRWLVHASNAERNAWDLLSVLRPALHSELQNKKERAWIQALRKRLQAINLDLVGPIPVQHNGRTTDLDALVLDRSNRFGVVCELKWLIEPGTVAGALRTDNEIEKGMRQVGLAHEWVQTIPQLLVDRTGLAASDLRQFDFRPLVMCKNTLPSGALRTPGIPVINERLFDWLLFEPHHRDLRTLWRVAEDLSYLPKQGVHFHDYDSEVEFHGVCFKLEGVSFVYGRPWNEEEDIGLAE